MNEHLTTDQYVKELITKFNKLQDSYLKESYDLLKEIYDIRKEQNSDYTIVDLENEEGLEEHRGKIRPLLKYSNISDEVRELQEGGELSNSQVFLMANLPNEMQDDESQKKIANLLINKEIIPQDLIGQINQYKILKMINSYNKMEFENRIVLSSVYEMKRIAGILRDHKDILSSPKYHQKLNENFELLERNFKNIMSEEQSLPSKTADALRGKSE
ncbi:hypothetical protein LCGC14_0852600 [marine sediment metagenome]|uniref:Uncharacterized protein n=1 Tax=marine sediment metagenome TaxID=412755 RepID=A0A0F9P9T8_9ZZZZ